MRRSPALRRIIPAIAVGALVLAACGSDDDSGGDSADDTSAPAATDAPADTAAEASGSASDMPLGSAAGSRAVGTPCCESWAGVGLSPPGGRPVACGGRLAPIADRGGFTGTLPAGPRNGLGSDI